MAKGGCPLGALGSQLAEFDPQARTLVAAGFGRWSTAIQKGMRSLHSQGVWRPGTIPMTLPSPCWQRCKVDYRSLKFIVTSAHCRSRWKRS